MDQRTCRICQESKPIDSFYVRESGARRTECKACMVDKVRAWREANPDRSNEVNRVGKRRRRKDPEYRRAELDADNARRRAKTMRGEDVTAECVRCSESFTYTYITKYRTVCPLCRSHDNEWKTFGLTGREAQELRSRGCCDICGGTRPYGRYDNWHIDHDHVTGEVRGILCAHCNTSLGLMADDPNRLRAAADYLDRFNNA